MRERSSVLPLRKIACRDHKFPTDMFSKLTAEKKLESFKTVVDEHYRYHQFYGGCTVAVLILYTGSLRHAIHNVDLRFLLVSVSFILFEWLTIVTGMDAFVRYVQRGTIIVKGSQHSILQGGSMSNGWYDREGTGGAPPPANGQTPSPVSRSSKKKKKAKKAGKVKSRRKTKKSARKAKKRK